MLTLRFQRQGKKRDFIFRIVAVDSKVAINSGKSKEILGWWDPRINKFELKKERILHWISQGAQPSDSCYNLLVRAKIVEGKKRPITIRKKKVKAEAGEKTAQAPVVEEKPTEEKPEGKVEEKAVEETQDEVKPEEKKEEIKEEIKEEKKEEVKKEIKEEPKTETVEEETKEEMKERPIEQKKEEVKEEEKKEESPEEKTK